MLPASGSVGEAGVGAQICPAEDRAESLPVPLPVGGHEEWPVGRLVDPGQGVARRVALLVDENALDAELGDRRGLHVHGGVQQADVDGLHDAEAVALHQRDQDRLRQRQAGRRVDEAGTAQDAVLQ